MPTENIRPFERFHQIVFWPLELTKLPGGGEFDLEARTKQLLAPDGPWEKLDPKDRKTSKDPNGPYAESVYFHPFARRFLYSLPPFEGAFHLFRREDVTRVRVVFNDDRLPEQTLKVERVHLYVFRTQVAILVVEVSGIGISREMVLRLEDEFRRIYPPYWESNGRAGHCPVLVQWLKGETPAGDPANYNDAKTLREGLPPVAAHWKWLVKQLEPYEQIEDDRAPSMVFLQNSTPELLSAGDLVRHCFYDGPGDPGEAPYSPAFLEDFWKKFAYARFWDPAPLSWMKTLYLCCGYGFTAITTPGGGFILEHFRHHYFQLGLLAHFHRATLLRFSSRFNEVMLEPSPERGFWGGLRKFLRGLTRSEDVRLEKMKAVREEFATFISTSWFHEVSNQEQGRELFELWTGHLRCVELMKNIRSEADAVEDVLSGHRQSTLADRVDRLTILLYVAAAATFTVALLDMDTVRNLLSREHIAAPLVWGRMLVGALMTGTVATSIYFFVMVAHEGERPRFALLLAIAFLMLWLGFAWSSGAGLLPW